MSEREILDQVGSYYEGKLAQHGATPRGVDWNSPESQRLRFQKLLGVCEEGERLSLNDFGCGYGALVDFLVERGVSFVYTGFDIALTMVAAARERHAQRSGCCFVSREHELPVADYTVASGIFNVRLGFDDAAWERYLTDTLERIDRVSRRGFAFNCLTRHSDADRMRPELYYADPAGLFEHCRARYSRRVALLHDYPLFEFTMLVRKQGGTP